MPVVSVIIPTYNDDLRLQQCLEALRKQDFRNGDYEIIIVNNSSIPLNAKLPDNRFKVLEELRPGSYAARNHGVLNARSEFLAFTDSDCLPDPSWLSEGVGHLEEHGVDRVAGEIKVFPRMEKMTPVECYEKIFAFDQKKNVRNGVAVTANLFVRKKVFDQVGFFNDKIFSGGDTEWNGRATYVGVGLGYSPIAIVRHPARHSWSELAEKIRRTTGGRFAISPEYSISKIRSLAPPVAAAYAIWGSGEGFRTQMWAFVIAYRVKIERFRALRRLRAGVTIPQRT